MAFETKALMEIAAQLPIVVAFGWFILKRDKDYQVAFKEKDNFCKEFISVVDANHAALLTTLQESNEKTILSMAEAVEKISDQVARNTSAIIIASGKIGDHSEIQHIN